MTALDDYLGELSLQGSWKRGAALAPDKGTRHELAYLRDPGGIDRSCSADLHSLIALMEKPRRTPPLFVSYFTENTPYEALADRLRASLDRLGLAHRIQGIPSSGSWVANTGLKSGFIEKAWRESDGPICWVDADAEFLRRPEFTFDNPFDMAVVRRHGWYDMSGFVYLNKTEAAGRIVSTWAALCRDNPHVWDQVLLTLAWFTVAKDNRVSSLFLSDGIFRFPRPWLRDLRDRLFYYPRARKMRPFIDQKQASRTLKSFIDGKAKRQNERGSDDLSDAFMTALKQHDFSFDARIETIFKG